MTPTLVTAAIVIAAGITGLMWPKSNIHPASIQAEDTIEPIPVRTLSYRSPMEALAEPPAYPAWTVRADGLWVPWTMQPPAWLTSIAGSYVVAESAPLPPERPAAIETPSSRRLWPLAESEAKTPPQQRIARGGDICEKHGLKKVYTDKYRWRCR